MKTQIAPYRFADAKSTFVEINGGHRIIRADRFKPGMLMVLRNDYPVMRHFKAGDNNPLLVGDPRKYPYFNAVFLGSDNPTEPAKGETIVMIVSMDQLTPGGEIWLTVLHDEIYYQVRHNAGIKQLLWSSEDES